METSGSPTWSTPEQVSLFARALLALGLSPGDRIALMMDNQVEPPITFLAAEMPPLTPVGKVLKKVLAEEVKQEFG